MAAARVAPRGGRLRRLLGVGGLVCGLGLVDLAPVAHAATQSVGPASDSTRTSTWTAGSSGCTTDGTRYLCMNDHADTTCASYIGTGAGAPNTMRFVPTAFTFSGTVSSVAVEYYDQQASSGVNTAAACLVVGGTDYCAATHGQSTTATLRTDTWLTNPCSGIAWTEAEVKGTAGSCNLTAFGFFTDDVNPTVRFCSGAVTVTYAAVANLQRRVF